MKTTKFQDPRYLGDPRNAVRIFNEKEVDELVLLDIRATQTSQPPQFELVREIVSEAFMPIACGGGIATIEHCAQLLELGVEKVVVNTRAVERPSLVGDIARRFGSQSVVVSIDAKRKRWGAGYEVHTHCGTRNTGRAPEEVARGMEDAGAGELLLTSIDRDGTMAGYDLDLIRAVTAEVSVPVVACGGGGSVADLEAAIKIAGASAAAAGSMFVFHGRHRAVLISFPDPSELSGLHGQQSS